MATHKYGEIKYNVGFNVDNQSLQQLKSQLKEINNITTTQFRDLIGFSGNKEDAYKTLRTLKQEANQVAQALEKAYNPTLGTTNLTKFSQEINKIGLKKLQQDFSQLGYVGNSAFKTLTTSLITTNTYVKQSSKLLNEMATSLKNTAKWGISSSIINNLASSVQKA